jgi:hypothetical protein
MGMDTENDILNTFLAFYFLSDSNILSHSYLAAPALAPALAQSLLL